MGSVSGKEYSQIITPTPKSKVQIVKHMKLKLKFTTLLVPLQSKIKVTCFIVTKEINWIEFLLINFCKCSRKEKNENFINWNILILLDRHAPFIIWSTWKLTIMKPQKSLRFKIPFNLQKSDKKQKLGMDSTFTC